MPLRGCVSLGCSYAKFDERGFSESHELGLSGEITFRVVGGELVSFVSLPSAMITMEYRRDRTSFQVLELFKSSFPNEMNGNVSNPFNNPPILYLFDVLYFIQTYMNIIKYI